MFRSVFLCFFFFLVSQTHAQVWFENGKDDKGNLNFFKIQEEAEKYFLTIDRTEKGKGYKPYKRWEEYWRHRVSVDGSFPEAGINQKNFETFLKENKNNLRNVNSNWTNLGPSTTNSGYLGIGRINCVAFHPTNNNIIWVGAPGGGVWKTTDGGNSWTTNFDQQSVLGITSIVIHPTNPDIIYIATGDGNLNNTYSTGVLKSINGGLTWQTTGLNWTVNQTRIIRKLIMDPDNPETLLAATSVGLFRTTNGGTNWTNVVNLSFVDVIANPNPSTNIFYAATASVLYKSTDNGATFSSVQTITNANRIVLGVSPHNPNYVYALCSRGSNNGLLGVYRSTDVGSTYTLRASSPNLLGWYANGNDIGGQGWYDLCIAVDPTNVDIVYTGGVNVWKSTDGGANWALRTHWSGASGVQTVHADHHCMAWQNNTTLWLGNDGGIYKTTNGGVNWTDHSNGLVISQMYRLDISQNNTRAISGLQDNGTKIRQTSGTWLDRIGGDGMDCVVRPDNGSNMIGSLYNGNFYKSADGGLSFSGITTADNNTGAWVTPIIVDPGKPQNLYIAYKRVHKSTDFGNTWTIISNQLNSNNMDFIAVAPSDDNYIYTGRNNALYRTTNGGTTWSAVAVPANDIREIAIHPTNPNIIWTVRSNYTAGEKVYRSVNGGSTWTNISANLPNLPANCIVYHTGTNDGIYVGMDVGVYYRDNSMSNWLLFSQGLPNVVISDLKIKYNTKELYAGTYGRGVWKSPLYDDSGTVCSLIQDMEVENVEVHSAVVRWIQPEVIPSGYQYVVSTSPAQPVSGTFTTDTMLTLINLLSNTDYYVHVKSVCNNNTESIWFTSSPFRTKATCNDISYDSGGSSGDYGDYENIIRYICPTGPYQQAILTFTEFATEADYDALYVYNGPDTTYPLFSSGNPVTLSGFPAGGYHGNSGLPGPFTSTHASGCLTLHFMSDPGVVDSGWRADITCLDNCTSIVRNTDDDGNFSLRNVVACAPNNTTISFIPTLDGDTIKILSPILIDKNITISPVDINLYIEADYTGHIFEILPGGSLTLANLHLIGGKGNTSTRVLFNKGVLNMTNVDILDTKANLGTGKSIDNEGTLNCSSLIEIRTN